MESRIAKTTNIDKTTATALAGVREILDRTVHSAVLEVGNYLLDLYFGGDVKRYRDHNPKKHTSLSKLLVRADAAGCTRSFLSNAINIAATARALPAKSAFRRLAPSLQVEVLRLRDPKIIETVAVGALKTTTTVRALRKVVAAKAPAARGGRKPTPSLLLAVNAALRALEPFEGFEKRAVESLSKEDRVWLGKLLPKLRATVNALNLKKRGG